MFLCLKKKIFKLQNNKDIFSFISLRHNSVSASGSRNRDLCPVENIRLNEPCVQCCIKETIDTTKLIIITFSSG